MHGRATPFVPARPTPTSDSHNVGSFTTSGPTTNSSDISDSVEAAFLIRAHSCYPRSKFDSRLAGLTIICPHLRQSADKCIASKSAIIK